MVSALARGLALFGNLEMMCFCASVSVACCDESTWFFMAL